MRAIAQLIDLTDDPRPAEPVEPDLNDCCGEGCMPCVYDTYDDARKRWKEALQAWETRHPEAAARPAP